MYICIYHHARSVSFRNGKDLPVQMRGDDTAAKRKKGGPPKGGPPKGGPPKGGPPKGGPPKGGPPKGGPPKGGPPKGGPPKGVDQEQVFLKMCLYLESSDEEQLTISDLCDKMSEYLDHKDSVPDAASYMKRILQDHYKDSIFIAEKKG